MKWEEIIKRQIEKHEEKYDPSVWESLSSKLDQKTVLPSPKIASNFKWWMIAASSLAIITTCLLLFNNRKTEAKATSPVVENKAIITEEKSVSQQNEHHEAKVESETIKNKTIEITDDKSPIAIAPTIVRPSSADKEITTPSSNNQLDFQDNRTENKSKVENTNNTPSKLSSLITLDWNNKICNNSAYLLANHNNEQLSLTNGTKIYRLKSGSSLKANELIAGTYQVIDDHGLIIKTIEIVGVPSIETANSEIYYENGLPYIDVRVNDNALNIQSWKLDHKLLDGANNNITEAIPAFSKGKHKVEVSGSYNSCPFSQATFIDVDEDYNLLAVTAFNVNSKDIRNRTFLPSALYERNTPFEMRIIDSETGNTIFETKSTSQPWDGRNSKTGELVEANKRFIWQVRLAQKANFEGKSIYQGLIMRVSE